MAIPAFNEHGLLPEGIHDCSLEEAQARFGGIRALREIFPTSALGTWRKKGHTKASAMIENEAQLRQAIEQIQGLCRAIDALRADVFPKNPRNFAILAEGPVDEIRKLQVEIDDYVSRLEGLEPSTAVAV